MTQFDLAIAWNWEFDKDYIHGLESECTRRGISVYEVRPDNLHEILEQLQTNAHEYLDRIAASLCAEGLRVRTAVVVESPAGAILDYVTAHAVDLIALATHGRGGVARWLVGGVADKVVRGASVPVLLHRPHDKAQAG